MGAVQSWGESRGGPRMPDLGSNGHSRILNGGFYKAHSVWGEVIILERKEAERPVRRRLCASKGLRWSSGIKNREERPGLRHIQEVE